MITKLKKEVFTTADGAEHGTIEAAKAHSLTKILGDSPAQALNEKDFARFLLEHADEIVDILTTKIRTRKPKTPKASKAAKKVEVKP